MFLVVVRFWIIGGVRIRNLIIEGGVSLNFLGYKDIFFFFDLKIVIFSYFNVFEIRVYFIISVYI